MRLNTFLFAILGLAVSKDVGAMGFSDWISCIQVANNSCPLDPGTYYVTSTIGTTTVASGVYMYGSGASPSSSTIYRDSSFLGTPSTTANLFYIPSSVSTSVIMENLTIDGGRVLYANVQATYPYNTPSLAGCDYNPTTMLADRDCGPSGYTGCTVPNFLSSVDVSADGSLVVSAVTFQNSAGTASLVYGSSTNGGVESSGFYYSRSAGLYSAGYIYAEDDDFQYNGGGAVWFAGTGTNTNLLWESTLTENKREMADGQGGGQVYVGGGATNARIVSNSINGDNYVTPSSGTITVTGLTQGCNTPVDAGTQQSVNGVEVDPFSSNVEVWGNDIYANTAPGITANNPTSLSISGFSDGSSTSPQYVHDNGPTNPEDLTAGCTPNCPTHGIDITGSSSGVTLSYVLSWNNAGDAIVINSNIGGTGWVGNQCLGPTLGSSYNGGFTGSGQLGNYATCPTVSGQYP